MRITPAIIIAIFATNPFVLSEQESNGATDFKSFYVAVFLTK